MFILLCLVYNIDAIDWIRFLSYDETVDTWCVQAVSYVREKLTNQEPRKFRTTSYTMWYGNGPHSSWMWIKITFVLLFLRNKHQIYTFLCFKINYAYHMIKIKPHSYRTCLLSHSNWALRPRAVFQQTRPQLMWFYHCNRRHTVNHLHNNHAAFATI